MAGAQKMHAVHTGSDTWTPSHRLSCKASTDVNPAQYLQASKDWRLQSRAAPELHEVQMLRKLTFVDSFVGSQVMLVLPLWVKIIPSNRKFVANNLVWHRSIFSVQLQGLFCPFGCGEVKGDTLFSQQATFDNLSLQAQSQAEAGLWGEVNPRAGTLTTWPPKQIPIISTSAGSTIWCMMTLVADIFKVFGRGRRFSKGCTSVPTCYKTKSLLF